jgi:opacity protein-like surface antigen
MLAAVVTSIVLLAGPAQAQKVPDATAQEVLIKSTLLTFNDANVTTNYTVLHAKMSKPFRDQFPPDKMKVVFKDFSEKHINIASIAAKTPVPDQPATINDDGVLTLQGHFDTSPKALKYVLGYIMSDGEWKPIRLKVDID